MELEAPQAIENIVKMTSAVSSIILQPKISLSLE